MFYKQVQDARMSGTLFLDAQYSKHAGHFDVYVSGESEHRIAESWFDKTTADYWRHARAYECVDLLKGFKDSSWLTVGDGRWGLDAIRIIDRGFSNVFPTDIAGALLDAAARKGLIDHFAVENAEKLSFADKSFDFVFCKESLHHFPRPLVALYEMIRVARHAVFLVEPNDTFDVVPAARGGGKIKQRIRDAMLLLLKGKLVPGAAAARFGAPMWEESGNFVYFLSRRDIEKVAFGLNLPNIVIKGLNDHYIKGCEFEPADESKSKIFRDIVSAIQRRDQRCKDGKCDYTVIMAGIFLQPIDAILRAAYSDAGWTVSDLPANPYVSR
jgi:SAM-dependent methyltransferase